MKPVDAKQYLDDAGRLTLSDGRKVHPLTCASTGKLCMECPCQTCTEFRTDLGVPF